MGLGAKTPATLLPLTHAFDITGVAKRLSDGSDGYEIVHASPGIEIGIYVPVAPEPDRQQPHEDDEVYVVLEGNGVLEIEGEPFEHARRGAVEGTGRGSATRSLRAFPQSSSAISRWRSSNPNRRLVA